MVYLGSDEVQHITSCLTCRQTYCLLMFDAVRLAPEEESHKLTGFVHNAVTCIGMETDIPVKFLVNIS
jgi:prolyl-tRNA editing enzyme YbaK/EbsC (Cys-tRNA(Pro) deacylase)